jgi:hypothetical protein
VLLSTSSVAAVPFLSSSLTALFFYFQWAFCRVFQTKFRIRFSLALFTFRRSIF